MQASRYPGRPGRAGQRGGYIVEFAFVAMIFVLAVFGIVEFGRMLYVFNTVQEVTRKAATAAVTANFRDAARLQRIREHAVLRDSPGFLPLGAPITDRHVRIEFLALTDTGTGIPSLEVIPDSQLPGCPMQNRHLCMAQPGAARCVRFVRARICDPANQVDCEQAHLELIIPQVGFTVAVPRASTLLPAESLGYEPGMGTCP